MPQKLSTGNEHFGQTIMWCRRGIAESLASLRPTLAADAATNRRGADACAQSRWQAAGLRLSRRYLDRLGQRRPRHAVDATHRVGRIPAFFARWKMDCV